MDFMRGMDLGANVSRSLPGHEHFNLAGLNQSIEGSR
jgi:hypothetical protein